MTTFLPFFGRTSCILNQYIVKNYLKKCVKYRYYSTAFKVKQDSQNVISSNFPDVNGFENIYLHDLIWDNIDKWPNHTAMVCVSTGRSYTYNQLRKACGKLATSLRKNNLLPKDIVTLILPNIPEYAIIALAASEAGLCVMPINPAYTVREIKKQLEIVGEVRAIFTVPDKYTNVKASIEKDSKLKLPIIIVNDKLGVDSIPGTINFNDLIRDDIEEFSVSQKTEISYEDTVYIPYSSGTTGFPKAIEISHRNICANIIQSMYPDVFPGMQTTENHQDIVPQIMPFYHAYGFNICMLHYLRIGAKLVCLPKFSVEGFVQLLKSHRCTLMHIVPPIVQIMISNKQILPNYIDSLRLITSGAASLGENSIEKFCERFCKTISFVQAYGASELSPLVSMGNPNAPPESCGYLFPNTQMRIVSTKDESLGKNLGLRESGEIYIRGPQIMKGYYKNPKATADSMDGDWYKTGDIGYYTEDALLYIKGRIKEMIKVKGYQVAPIELEEVIRDYHDVQDVAVIGVEHDFYGEIPKAFIVPKPGTKLDVEQLKKFVSENVAKYKQLGHVQIVDSIPKTSSGKILRRELHKL